MKYQGTASPQTAVWGVSPTFNSPTLKGKTIWLVLKPETQAARIGMETRATCACGWRPPDQTEMGQPGHAPSPRPPTPPAAWAGAWPALSVARAHLLAFCRRRRPGPWAERGPRGNAERSTPRVGSIPGTRDVKQRWTCVFRHRWRKRKFEEILESEVAHFFPGSSNLSACIDTNWVSSVLLWRLAFNWSCYKLVTDMISTYASGILQKTELSALWSDVRCGWRASGACPFAQGGRSRPARQGRRIPQPDSSPPPSGDAGPFSATPSPGDLGRSHLGQRGCWRAGLWAKPPWWRAQALQITSHATSVESQRCTELLICQ